MLSADKEKIDKSLVKSRKQKEKLVSSLLPVLEKLRDVGGSEFSCREFFQWLDSPDSSDFAPALLQVAVDLFLLDPDPIQLPVRGEGIKHTISCEKWKFFNFKMFFFLLKKLEKNSLFHQRLTHRCIFF